VTPTSTQIGYVVAYNTGSNTSLTSTVSTDLGSGSLTLPAGVWSLVGTILFNTASGTNSGVSHIQGSVRESTETLGQTNSVKIPTSGASFGTGGSGFILQHTRILANTSSATYYLTANSTFTGSLQCSSVSKIVAVRIA
jgi:hypothetical protein